MKKPLRQLAALGGTPAFESAVPVGQLYFPAWRQYEAVFRDIFDREYYTNHGPLAQQAEAQLAEFLGVKNVVCVTNATIGLIMAATALSLSGRVIVPAFTFVATAQSLTWAGLEPVFCDVDPLTHHMTPEAVEPLLDHSISAILGVNLWGGTCDPTLFEDLAESHDVTLYFDSAQAFGCELNGRRLGAFGTLEVFSFHATKILGTAEGGCVCTDDDDLAARLRNIRSSYGAGRPVPVPITTNGRFSEAQAALCILALDDFEERRRHNQLVRQIYRDGFENMLGFQMIEPPTVDRSNEQCAVFDVDPERFGLDRDTLWRSLKAEGIVARRYFYPGLHRVPPYVDSGAPPSLPNTDYLCNHVLQLPVGALVQLATAEKIVQLVADIRDQAEFLRNVLKS